MGMRSNQMIPSEKVRSYANTKPSLLQIIGVKRIVIIVLVFVLFFVGGCVALKEKQKREIAKQEQELIQAEKDDNYFNFMNSLMQNFYGCSYECTIENADFGFSNKSVIQHLNDKKVSSITVSGLCNSENITGDISYMVDGNNNSVYYTTFFSRKDGVYYNVRNYCSTEIDNSNIYKDADSQYMSLMDNASFVKYPASSFYNCYNLYSYLESVFESAKNNPNVEMAKSVSDDGLPQYSAKIPSGLFLDDNCIALLFSQSESPVVCSINCLGGDFGARQFYLGFQQDDLKIQFNLTENTDYGIPQPIYAVSEEQFLSATMQVKTKIDALLAEEAKKEAEQEKKNDETEKKTANSESEE